MKFRKMFAGIISAAVMMTAAYVPSDVLENTGITASASLGTKGDANGDGKVDVRDCAYIAKMIAQGRSSELPLSADFNGDGKVNVRDAAAIAKKLGVKVSESKLYPYQLMNMTAENIVKTLGNYEVSTYNREGTCNQITSSKLPDVHILFDSGDYHSQSDIYTSDKPIKIVVDKGYACPNLYTGMTLSACLNSGLNVDSAYVNHMDGGIDVNFRYNNCTIDMYFNFNLPSSYYSGNGKLSNSDLRDLTSKNPTANRLTIKK